MVKTHASINSPFLRISPASLSCLRTHYEHAPSCSNFHTKERGNEERESERKSFLFTLRSQSVSQSVSRPSSLARSFLGKSNDRDSFFGRTDLGHSPLARAAGFSLYKAFHAYILSYICSKYSTFELLPTYV